MKAFVISLDLLIASSIALTAVVLLAVSIENAETYLVRATASQSRVLSLVTISQEISAAISSNPMNYSEAQSFAAKIAKENGMASDLVNNTGSADSLCFGTSGLCRFVTFSNRTYVLVVNYESPDKP